MLDIFTGILLGEVFSDLSHRLSTHPIKKDIIGFFLQMISSIALIAKFTLKSLKLAKQGERHQDSHSTLST